MVFDCLKLCQNIQLDYLEISVEERQIPTGYAFYLFNYHPHTMSWLDTRSLRKLLGFTGTIVLEVLPGDPFVLCPEYDFDYYCVLDPTIKSRNKRVYSFPRPLPKIESRNPYIDQTIPVIGSFGFATKGKGFQHVVEAVNKEFDKAIVRINIPYGDYVPDSKEYAAYLENICKGIAKEGIEVVVTHDFMSDDELIKWCGSNTLNCFLYDRKMPGLSATTDQAIVSGRPLSISKNNTFRHITEYIKPYPEWSLKDSIEKSVSFLDQIQSDWSQETFAKTFEILIDKNKLILNKESEPSHSITLLVKKRSLEEAIKNRYKKYKRKFTLQHLKTILYDKGHNKKII